MFPNLTSADSPWTNPETNVQYQYNNGVWEVMPVPIDTDISELDKRYLQLSGGEMTGTIKSKLVKSVRDTGFAFEVKPLDNTTRGSWSTSGRIDITMANAGDAAIRTIGSINVKKKGEGIGGTNIITLGSESVSYFGPTTSSTHVATKDYVDNTFKVKVVSSTPSSLTKGDMWFNTSDNILYIKKS